MSMGMYDEDAIVEDCRERRVPAAAVWLDENYPGWAATIGEDFDISDPHLCVGGHLHVDWEVLRNGFEHDTGIDPSGVFSSQQDVWQDEIDRRV